jgi:hypothetical protein
MVVVTSSFKCGVVQLRVISTGRGFVGALEQVIKEGDVSGTSLNVGSWLDGIIR